MKNAASVVVGNQYLAEYALASRSKHVELLPTVVDINSYISKPDSNINSNSVCVGWIGQRSTAKYLLACSSVFQELSQAGGVSFVAVGIEPRDLGLAMQGISWTEDTEIRSIQSFDIGIMPLPDGDFEKGKCGYKLIQYMACGLPVIASPVGINTTIVEHGVNGFIATSEQDWRDYIKLLVSDPVLRKKMGKMGRLKIENEYSIENTTPRLVELFKHLVQDQRLG
jgi:glycosyltransferase involved in cell wall biosynthesis